MPTDEKAGDAATGEGAVVVEETGENFYTQAISVGGRHQLRADEPLAVGGTDTGPAPYDYLLMALGSCTSMTLRLYAERRDLKLDKVRVTLSHDKIHAEDCADCETKEGRIDRIMRHIHLEGDLSPADRQKLLEIAEKCPVHRTLKSEIKIETDLAE